MDKYYNNTAEYAKDWCIINGIKIHTVDNANRQQLPSLATIYLNRIGNKTRILPDTTKHRNIIAVSVDTERHNLDYWRHRIKSLYKAIDNYRTGSCQQHINCQSLQIVLCGILNKNCTAQTELLNQKIQPCSK